MNKCERLSALVRLLLDGSAPVEDRDDAAMDLGAFDVPEAVTALVQVAMNPREDPAVLASVGESIGEIWRRNPTLSRIPVDRLAPAARAEIEQQVPDAS